MLFAQNNAFGYGLRYHEFYATECVSCNQNLRIRKAQPIASAGPEGKGCFLLRDRRCVHAEFVPGQGGDKRIDRNETGFTNRTL